MNRATRDKFVKRTDQTALTSGNACWETAPLVFARLNEDFGPFDIDLTADARRNLCRVWFGPGSEYETDALSAAWRDYGCNGYSNPPYGDFVKMMLRKAKEEALAGFTSTLLLPLRVTRAFKDYVLDGASDLLLCDKRLVFFEAGVPRCSMDRKGKLRPDTALFDSMIVRYTPGRHGAPRLGLWKVPKHVMAEDLDRAAFHMREAA